ncbi:MAG TPA: DNA adenine methylase [Kofleriaceae bacterium]|nr:DNA adenine methylase [Kofleriaceae bacterium]
MAFARPSIHTPVSRPAKAPTPRRRPVPPLAPFTSASPVVKWAGGKSRLLAELCARAPAAFDRYFEPFAGGAALYFRLAPATAILADVNRDLIATYQTLAGAVEEVIVALAEHRDRHSKAHYYAVREAWNDPGAKTSQIARAAAFIYLNKTCYNGLWRVNRRGLFNVPMGRYSAPRIFDPHALRAAARALRRAQLIAAPYAEVIAEAAAGDFIYFDPPYQPLSTTANFTSYSRDAFAEDDQAALAQNARDLAERGCHVMVSNSDTPLIRELYADFHIATVKCARAINSKGSCRGQVNEVIITARR